MSLKTRKKIIYWDRPLTDQEQASTDPRYVQGTPKGPKMLDKTIKADEVRMPLNKDEGNLCIGVRGGSNQIGEIYVNVQFEGPKNQADICMAGQNELFLQSSDWLKEIFGEFQANWEATIEAEPCPKTAIKLKIEQATQVLEGNLTLEKALSETKHEENVVISNRYQIENRT